MPNMDDHEPPRWRQLCAELQREADPAKFQALLEEIDRVLIEYEKTKQAKKSCDAGICTSCYRNGSIEQP